MQLNVGQQLRQPVGAVTVVDLEEPLLSFDDTELRALAGSATLLRSDRGLLVTVHAKATVHERCSRCLGDASCPVDIDFEEEYVPIVDVISGAAVHLSEEDDVFRIGPEFILDLREALRQYTLISEPAKPLCRPDCAGLCPTCGADLNRGPCDCPPHADERWQALAGLKTVGEEGS